MLRRFACTDSLDGDLRKQAAVILRARRQSRCGVPRDLAIRFAYGAVGIGRDRRFTTVGLLTNTDVQRHRAEKRHVVLVGHAPATVRTENVLLKTTV